jgi:two-component system, NarL family, nitrate/nitrite response regulator NarL
MTPSRIRVMLADDHPVVTEGVSARLEKSLNISLVTVATSFAETLELLRTVPIDVLILDLGNMGGSALVTVAQVRQHHPHVGIVVFSSAVAQAPDLVLAGVLGFVIKEDSLQHLEQAILAAIRQQPYFSPIVRQYLERDSQTQISMLVPKEREVLELLDQGFGTVETARLMAISPGAVQNYITGMNRKIGCKSRHQLIAWYRRNKQIDAA